MPELNPYRMHPVFWEREMTHNKCALCRKAARFAKTDTIVNETDEATRTIEDEHTATVIRRERSMR
jgi:hypothetical protein